MARLVPSNVRIRINVDTSEVHRALDLLVGHRAIRKTLMALSAYTRLTGPRLAAILWPSKDPEPRKSIAEGRLRDAAKAGYAHVAFEPHSWTKDHAACSEIRPTYEISARGRAALGGA